MTTDNAAFTGSIPNVYHNRLGPMLFEPYAKDLAVRLRLEAGAYVLESAAGTGILTKEICARMPEGCRIVATDLNPDMLEIAKQAVSGPVEWRQADAQDLPFDDASFDTVVCQYGVMFFPDKVQAFAETCRVLKDGGEFVFNVWNSLERHKMVAIADDVVRGTFPDDPPMFYHVPFGYSDRDRISADLKDGGFDDFEFEEVNLTSGTYPVDQVAEGFVQGNPTAAYVTENGGDPIAVTREVADALREHFGGESFRVDLSAQVVHVRKT